MAKATKEKTTEAPVEGEVVETPPVEITAAAKSELTKAASQAPALIMDQAEIDTLAAKIVIPCRIQAGKSFGMRVRESHGRLDHVFWTLRMLQPIIGQ